jgi:ABC-type lipoprotein release transport system permease subunit
MLRTLERQRHLLDFALTSLLRRRGKNITLVTVYTLVIFLFASVLFLTASLRHEAAMTLINAPEITVQRSLMGRFEPIPISYADSIRKIRGVTEVKPRLWGYHYDPGFKANYTLLVSDAQNQQPGSITLGPAISRLRGAYEGDIITMTGSNGKLNSFQVTGILSGRTEIVSADLLLMAEKDFRQLTGLSPDLATDLAVKVLNPNEQSTIAAKIVATFPDTRPIIRNEILRTYDALFSWRSGMVLLVLATTLLSFLILAWDKATGLSAEERREIGILKAVGWETSDILMMKLWEGIAVSLVSLLLGGGLAYAHVFIGQAPLILPVLKGWSTLSPQLSLTPHITLNLLIVLGSLTLIPYSVATIVPAWRAATIDPDMVMRS